MINVQRGYYSGKRVLVTVDGSQMYDGRDWVATPGHVDRVEGTYSRYVDVPAAWMGHLPTWPGGYPARPAVSTERATPAVHAPVPESGDTAAALMLALAVISQAQSDLTDEDPGVREEAKRFLLVDLWDPDCVWGALASLNESVTRRAVPGWIAAADAKRARRAERKAAAA